MNSERRLLDGCYFYYSISNLNRKRNLADQGGLMAILVHSGMRLTMVTHLTAPPNLSIPKTASTVFLPHDTPKNTRLFYRRNLPLSKSVRLFYRKKLKFHLFQSFFLEFPLFPNSTTNFSPSTPSFTTIFPRFSVPISPIANAPPSSLLSFFDFSYFFSVF